VGHRAARATAGGGRAVSVGVGVGVGVGMVIRVIDGAAVNACSSAAAATAGIAIADTWRATDSRARISRRRDAAATA
jgi:hypothetical protein